MNWQAAALCKQTRPITSDPTCFTAPSIAIPVLFVPYDKMALIKE